MLSQVAFLMGGASLAAASLSNRQEGKSYSEALASVGWRSQFMGFTTRVLSTLCVGGRFVFENGVLTN